MVEGATSLQINFQTPLDVCCNWCQYYHIILNWCQTYPVIDVKSQESWSSWSHVLAPHGPVDQVPVYYCYITALATTAPWPWATLGSVGETTQENPHQAKTHEQLTLWPPIISISSSVIGYIDTNSRGSSYNSVLLILSSKSLHERSQWPLINISSNIFIVILSHVPLLFVNCNIVNSLL